MLKIYQYEESFVISHDLIRSLKIYQFEGKNSAK
jgi:hypothetical protein